MPGRRRACLPFLRVKLVGQLACGSQIIRSETRTAERFCPSRARFLARAQQQAVGRRLQFQAVRPAVQNQFDGGCLHGVIFHQSDRFVNFTLASTVETKSAIHAAKKRPSFPKAALRFLGLIFTAWPSIPQVLPVSARVPAGLGLRRAFFEGIISDDMSEPFQQLPRTLWLGVSLLARLSRPGVSALAGGIQTTAPRCPSSARSPVSRSPTRTAKSPRSPI